MTRPPPAWPCSGAQQQRRLAPSAGSAWHQALQHRALQQDGHSARGEECAGTTLGGDADPHRLPGTCPGSDPSVQGDSVELRVVGTDTTTTIIIAVGQESSLSIPWLGRRAGVPQSQAAPQTCQGRGVGGLW